MKDIHKKISILLMQMNMRLPLFGFYDAPDPEPFMPLVEPEKGDCAFLFYEQWLKGNTLHLTKERYGCGGAGNWMFGIQGRSKEEFISFLVDEEGLKASHELMEKWIDTRKPYKALFPHLFIGPLKENLLEYARTVTFFVDPDQLSILMLGAQYFSSPDDPPPVIAPFGSGCSLLQPFRDLSLPQAALGATDIAMRRHIPPALLAFTVTMPMFFQLLSLDKRSFLYKRFFAELKKARDSSRS
ncbi:MAG: DUF169 domain-containing protein [Candidatus Aminicenantes bacterium]|nr:DUF169 domain-containing protein [Candidatus Aminicenantes bacterium]